MLGCSGRVGITRFELSPTRAQGPIGEPLEHSAQLLNASQLGMYAQWTMWFATTYSDLRVLLVPYPFRCSITAYALCGQLLIRDYANPDTVWL